MAEETPLPPAPDAAGPTEPVAAVPPSPETTQTPTSAATAAPSAPDASGEALDQVSIEELLKQASFEDPVAVGAGSAAEAAEFNLPNFQQVIQDAQVSSIDL